MQNAYICGCVKVLSIKRHYSSTEATPKRNFSGVYYVNNSGVSTQVCKTAFLRIHGVSNGRVNRALQVSLKEGGTPHQDQWGRHVPANKTTEEDLAAVRQRIKMFPKYRSHYSRADNPNREYLNPELSTVKMYVCALP